MYLSIFCSGDGSAAVKDGRLHMARKADPVVPVDVAPDEPPNKMRWLGEKPAQPTPTTPKVQKI